MTNIWNIFVRGYRTSAKAGLALTQVLIDITIGLMLGDLHAERKTIRNNTRLQFMQSSKHALYIAHLYNLFVLYVGSVPKSLSLTGGLPHMAGKVYGAMKFNTLSLPCFNMFRELFYNKDGVKVLPANLGSLLTPIGVAFWFMDDGYKHENEFAFCTDSFTYMEHVQLVNIMKANFDLDCSIRRYRDTNRLYVRVSSRDKFIAMVKPHMIPLFHYKLGL